MVDGLVFPERALAGGWHGLRVGVIGNGVNRQKHETGAAIHLDFDSIHALFRPIDVHLSGVELHVENGFHGVHVHNLIRADDLQGLADGVGVAGRGFDAGDVPGIDYP